MKPVNVSQKTLNTMRIEYFIEQAAKRWPDKIAVLDPELSITYSQLVNKIQQLKSKLEQNGVCPTNTVGVRIKNGHALIIATLAAVSASCVVLPIDTHLSAAETNEIIETSLMDFLLEESGAKSMFNPPGAILDLEPGVLLNLVHINRSSKSCVTELVPDAAFMRFTSGTTGKKKGVILSHRSILERTQAANRGLKLGPDDTVLWVLPMAYHFFVSVLLYLRYGATIIIPRNTMPETLIQTINDQKVTFMYASPLHYRWIASVPSEQSLPSLRHAVSTSIRLDQAIAVNFQERYKITLSQAYGIIEIGLPLINLQGCADWPGSVGKALSGFDIKILDESYRPLPANEIGQLAVRGPGMFEAYLDPFQLRDDVLVNNLFLTGDQAKIDSEGFVTIVGRLKSMINVAGQKVFPEQVQEVLNRHPSVSFSRVTGIPHPKLGEVVRAEVVLNKQVAVVQPMELIQYCRRELSPFKVPQEIKIVKNIQKTGSGKVRY